MNEYHHATSAHRPFFNESSRVEESLMKHAYLFFTGYWVIFIAAVWLGSVLAQYRLFAPFFIDPFLKAHFYSQHFGIPWLGAICQILMLAGVYCIGQRVFYAPSLRARSLYAMSYPLLLGLILSKTLSLLFFNGDGILVISALFAAWMSVFFLEVLYRLKRNSVWTWGGDYLFFILLGFLTFELILTCFCRVPCIFILLHLLYIGVLGLFHLDQMQKMRSYIVSQDRVHRGHALTLGFLLFGNCFSFFIRFLQIFLLLQGRKRR